MIVYIIVIYMNYSSCKIIFFLSEKRIQGIIREYESSKNQDGGSNNE